MLHLTPSNLVALVVALVASLACGWVAHSLVARRDETRPEVVLAHEDEAEVIRLRQEYARLERKLASLELQRAPAMEDASTDVHSKPHSDTDATARPSKASEQWPTTPALAELKARRGAHATYYPLIQSMNLSEQQAEEFIALMTSEQLNQPQPGDAEQSKGLPQTLEPQTLDEKVQAIIGYENLKGFQNFQLTLMDQVRANQIAASLNSIGLPLTSQERAAVADAMIGARRSSPLPTNLESDPLSLVKVAAWQEDHDRRVLERLTPVLRTKQLNVIKEQFRSVELTYQELAKRQSESVATGSDTAPPALLPLKKVPRGDVQGTLP